MARLPGTGSGLRGESPEGLAQETALRALELERPDGAPIRPWLASIMRGLRANRRRTERRRSWREQRGSHPSGEVDDRPSPARSAPASPILRPPGLQGDWKLRARREDDPGGPWRGGWTDGTDEANTEFSAVDACYWWFHLSPTGDFNDPVAESVFDIAPGDGLLLGNGQGGP